MPRRTVYPGERFGKLTVLSYPVKEFNERIIKVKCDCGTEFERPVGNIYSPHNHACKKCLNRKHFPGQRFGKLVILDYSKKGKIKVKCDCGEVAEKGFDSLKRGRFHTCIASPRKPSEILENLIGKKFNRLEVINYDHINKKGTRYWRCKCDCGKDSIVSTAKLKKGTTKSCGCFNSDRGTEPGEFGLRKIFRRTRDQAKKRNIIFNLSIEDFKVLTKKVCFYCGIEPYMISYKKQVERSQYIYNGIDRKDSNKGYTLENSVPCCKLCNWMKRTLTVDQFLNHITSIYRHSVKNE